MKIVHIVEACFAGVGRHVLDLCLYQSKNHCVTVIFSGARCSQEFYERLRWLETQHGVVSYECNFSRGMHLGDIGLFYQCKKYIAGIAPDIVHGHSTKGGLVSRVCSCEGAKVIYTPNAIYTMNPGLSAFSRKVVGGIERYLSRRTDAIICVSPEEKVHVKKLGVDERLLAVIPNGIDPPAIYEKNLIRKELNIPQSDMIVGFVGRIDKQKAPQRILDVFAGLVECSKKQVVLVMVGDGPLLEESKVYALKIGIDKHVRWVGSRAGVWAMQAFDCFLLPSDYEGFPYVVVEACAVGLPVITTSQSNVSIIVEDGVSGYVCDKDDIVSLVQALCSYVDNPAELQSASRHAITRAKEFTLERMFENVMKLYAHTHSRCAS
ncbi:hypothetical protein AB833_02605 [Chromatiales bacterium (ex Bugula neritina AB1)]|nr:hypothetical protein AB833_02605 [Chromatiales bacterium (ex Bugula neritina AB1)]